MWTWGAWIALPFDFAWCAYCQTLRFQLPGMFPVSMFIRSSEWGVFLGVAPEIFQQLGIVIPQEVRDGFRRSS